MKSGSISVLNSTSAIIGTAVVDTSAPVMRLGNVVDAAISADPAVLNLFVIDPQTGKVVVLLDADLSAVLTAISGSAGRDTTARYVATGDTKAKLWLQDGGDIVPATVEDAGDFSLLDAALSLPVQPSLPLASAISRVEDTLVNDEDHVSPILIVVSQTDEAMYVSSFDTNAHALAAYALAIAASTKQAEFLCTPPVTTASVKEFFA